jgi:hypothetical protein
MNYVHTGDFERKPTANIIYKILGFRWLLEHFCPAPTFVTADSDDARNPQHFIYVTVVAELNTVLI